MLVQPATVIAPPVLGSEFPPTAPPGWPPEEPLQATLLAPVTSNRRAAFLAFFVVVILGFLRLPATPSPKRSHGLKANSALRGSLTFDQSTSSQNFKPFPGA
jgi:hypothetical protein